MRTRTPMLLTCSLATLVFLTACLHVENGRPIDSNKVSQIQKGVTTRAEVESLLGQPTTVAMAGDGKRVLVYTYFKSHTTVAPFVGAVGGERTSQRLQVIVNTNNVVQDFELSSDGNQAH